MPALRCRLFGLAQGKTVIAFVLRYSSIRSDFRLWVARMANRFTLAALGSTMMKPAPMDTTWYRTVVIGADLMENHDE